MYLGIGKQEVPVEKKGFKMDDKHICSICGKEFEGFGNNAEPVNDGICCDKCNMEVVIPRRLADLNKKEPVDVKQKVKDFLNEFYKIKYDMILKEKLEEVRDVNGPSDEFIDKLFKETSRKMYDMAKDKLDDDVVQGILFGYIGVVDDDLDLVFALYELVHDKKVKLVGIDLDVFFK